MWWCQPRIMNCDFIHTTLLLIAQVPPTTCTVNCSLPPQFETLLVFSGPFLCIHDKNSRLQLGCIGREFDATTPPYSHQAGTLSGFAYSTILPCWIQLGLLPLFGHHKGQLLCPVDGCVGVPPPPQHTSSVGSCAQKYHPLSLSAVTTPRKPTVLCVEVSWCVILVSVLHYETRPHKNWLLGGTQRMLSSEHSISPRPIRR